MRDNPPDFTQAVYDVVAKIPKGSVMTYKQVAEEIGNPGAFRAVGTALSRNIDPKKVPCHRVVGRDGSMHGYAFGGAEAKIEILKKEGVKIKDGKVVF